MTTELLFYARILKCTAHRPVRDELCDAVLCNPELSSVLLHTALNVKDTAHHKACWVMELVMESNMHWMAMHMDQFCDSLQLYVHDGALRSVSKICMFASRRHYKSQFQFLAPNHVNALTEACFDWLIGDAKVATKAYAMRTVYELGKQHTWMHTELTQVIQAGYHRHSAGYKSAAKDVLKKIG